MLSSNVNIAEGAIAVDPEETTEDAENAARKEGRGERADMCESSLGIITADKVVYDALRETRGTILGGCEQRNASKSVHDQRKA
jgi:hypothetical protein